MEFKEYIKIFRKQKKIIFDAAIVVFISAMVFTFLKPVSYDNDLALLISRKGAQETANYKYDGYYAGQAADAFADNVSQWLSSASLVNEIYSRAKINNDFASFKNFSKVFKAKKMASQYIEVRYQTKDSKEAVDIAHAIVDVLQEKADSLSKANNEEVSFKIIYNDPFTLREENNIFFNAILAIVGGLFLGMFAALAKEYFNNF